MKAIWIREHGGPEVLEVRESSDPQPGPGEVRIRVRACGLNFSEVMARQGVYPDAPRPPCVVGYEVAGEIDALGAGVVAPELGTRVVAMTRFGGHADHVCLDARHVHRMPDGMSFDEGAAIPVVYVTAYHMLFKIARIEPGTRVLVHMAAGGVGLAALQLCRTVPGVVTFGTASASKHDVLRAHGCTHPIDYRDHDYVSDVMRITGGRGVDVILDALGGEDWEKGYGLLRPAGMLVAFGFANVAANGRRSFARVARAVAGVPRFSPVDMMDDNRAVAGVNIGHLWDEMELLDGHLRAVLDLYRRGKIRPVIDSRFPFEQAAEAHRRMHERRNVGKIVLQP